MCGILANVAEVKHLRHRLMTAEVIVLILDLLNRESRDTLCSFHAAGIIASLASDGIEAWTISKPSREFALDQMIGALQKWDFECYKIVEFTSLQPILTLLNCYHTPACQMFAVWALAKNTKVS